MDEWKDGRVGSGVNGWKRKMDDWEEGWMGGREGG